MILSRTIVCLGRNEISGRVIFMKFDHEPEITEIKKHLIVQATFVQATESRGMG